MERKPPLVFADRYSFDWPGHVFPTGKYRALAESLRDRHPGIEFHAPAPASRERLRACHREEYLDRLAAIAGGEVPWDPRFECPVNGTVLDAFRLGCGGSVLAAGLAAEEGWSANLGGGFHHAYPDHGEGFCLLNDIVVAAKALLASGRARAVLVVDVDVHQGNGTAVMAREDPGIFSFSLHQQNNYPPKEVSDLDVGLPDLADDDVYLGALAGSLRRIEREFDPDFVLYVAGADPFREDRLGGLSVTREGLRERDRLVFDFAERHGAPVAAMLAGGYARREEDVVGIHRDMVEELLRRWGGPG